MIVYIYALFFAKFWTAIRDRLLENAVSVVDTLLLFTLALPPLRANPETRSDSLCLPAAAKLGLRFAWLADPLGFFTPTS